MAERIQKFLWDNRAILDAVLVTASSQQASNPLSYIRIPFQTQRWRSSFGYNVVANWNDRYRFRDNGVIRDAILTVGNYATPVAFAAHLQTQINAAAGITNTYTFVYSGSGLFTHARATGTNTFGPYGVDGDGARSAHADVGFFDTDHTGALSYLSDFPAYHSREWIRWDYTAAGGINTPQAAAIVGFNMGTGGTVRLISSTIAAAWTSLTANTTLAGDDLSRLRITHGQAFAGRNFWMMIFKDQGNAAGYTECGVPFLGPELILSQGTAQGWTEKGADGSLVTRGDLGGWMKDARPSPRVRGGIIQSGTRTDRDNFRSMYEAIGVAGHLFFMNDATNYPASDTLYGVLAEARDATAGPGDGVPAERFDMRYSIAEEPQ